MLAAAWLLSWPGAAAAARYNCSPAAGPAAAKSCLCSAMAASRRVLAGLGISGLAATEREVARAGGAVEAGSWRAALRGGGRSKGKGDSGSTLRGLFSSDMFSGIAFRSRHRDGAPLLRH